MHTFSEGNYDVIVVGAGHAGCEAALAAARLGMNTAMLTLNLDGIAFLACKNADKTALQIRMLNEGKGEAVQSLRCQCDKNAYHAEMKRTLENTENLHIVQGECVKILTENGRACGIETAYGGIFYAKAVILATGVYLNAETITGELRQTGLRPQTDLPKALSVWVLT